MSLQQLQMQQPCVSLLVYLMKVKLTLQQYCLQKQQRQSLKQQPILQLIHSVDNAIHYLSFRQQDCLSQGLIDRFEVLMSNHHYDIIQSKATQECMDRRLALSSLLLSEYTPLHDQWCVLPPRLSLPYYTLLQLNVFKCTAQLKCTLTTKQIHLQGVYTPSVHYKSKSYSVMCIVFLAVLYEESVVVVSAQRECSGSRRRETHVLRQDNNKHWQASRLLYQVAKVYQPMLLVHSLILCSITDTHLDFLSNPCPMLIVYYGDAEATDTLWSRIGGRQHSQSLNVGKEKIQNNAVSYFDCGQQQNNIVIGLDKGTVLGMNQEFIHVLDQMQYYLDETISNSGIDQIQVLKQVLKALLVEQMKCQGQRSKNWLFNLYKRLRKSNMYNIYIDGLK